MKVVRDEMFRDLLDKITNWKVPALALAGWVAVGPAALIGALITSFTGTSPTLLNYFSKKKSIEKKHSISYLLKLL